MTIFAIYSVQYYWEKVNSSTVQCQDLCYDFDSCTATEATLGYVTGLQNVRFDSAKAQVNEIR